MTTAIVGVGNIGDAVARHLAAGGETSRITWVVAFDARRIPLFEVVGTQIRVSWRSS